MYCGLRAAWDSSRSYNNRTVNSSAKGDRAFMHGKGPKLLLRVKSIYYLLADCWEYLSQISVFLFFCTTYVPHPN
jgi:hypothetical protein